MVAKKQSLQLNEKAPLCKGIWRRRRLRDCNKIAMIHTIPPSFSYENATSLYTRETSMFVLSVRAFTQGSLYVRLKRSHLCTRGGFLCCFGSPFSFEYELLNLHKFSSFNHRLSDFSPNG